MKKHFLTFLVISPFLCFAQETEEQKSKLSIGLNFSSNSSYRVLQASGAFQSFVDNRENIEHPAFGFNTGVGAQYLLFEKIEIDVAIQYARYSTAFDDVPLTMQNGNFVGFGRLKYRFDYVELPIRINYRFVNENSFFYVSVGTTVGKFVKDNSLFYRTYQNGDNEKVSTTSGITSFNQRVHGIIGGIGYGYNLSERFNLRIEPLFRYTLTPLANAPVQQNNYSMGCQLGGCVKL